MTDLITRAAIYTAHQAVGQRRKYTGEPYHLHPAAVAKTVESVGGTEAMIAAAAKIAKPCLAMPPSVTLGA